ncbi:YlxR family protein [Corynebacterium sp.]|uniref:YlxR family protein n=1 Tax=Corynebacterium sp. TaxID=1720 RepID=UPI0026DB5092|nr:YlxR family protein [Corynebacterium sp.]MDO5075763.1 YlxR family protein [Corynebacterium sp.]
MVKTPEHQESSGLASGTAAGGCTGKTIRIRTCIATRQRFHDSDLLRVVLDPEQPGVAIPDPGRRLPGRGAWITPTIQALDLAEARRAFGRALRAATSVDAGPVRKYLAGHTELEAGKTEH